MGMRDFFRGDHDRDRDRWRERSRDEERYGRGEEPRYMQGRDWGREEDEREAGRYGSYSGGFENPQFYGQSGRSDWRESDYGRERESGSQGDVGRRDWGRDYGDRYRMGEERAYGSGRRYEGGFYAGESGRGGYGGGPYRGYGSRYGGNEYGGEAGGERSSEREQGLSAWGRAGYSSSQTGAAFSGSHRGRGPKGYQRSDERIREDVCECLTDDPMVDATNMEVHVKSGEVTLTGTVNSRLEKRRAVEIIEDLSGVKDVHNNLRVASESTQGMQQASGTQQMQQPRH